MLRIHHGGAATALVCLTIYLSVIKSKSMVLLLSYEQQAEPRPEDRYKVRTAMVYLTAFIAEK